MNPDPARDALDAIMLHHAGKPGVQDDINHLSGIVREVLDMASRLQTIFKNTGPEARIAQAFEERIVEMLGAAQ